MAIHDGGFALDHVKRMHHMDQAGFNIGSSITAILPMAHIVYTGDDDGRVVCDSVSFFFSTVIANEDSMNGIVYNGNESCVDVWTTQCVFPSGLSKSILFSYRLDASMCSELRPTAQLASLPV